MRDTNPSVTKPISIVIVDATGITSDLLKRAFSEQPEYEVVGCTKNSQETVRMVTATKPDTIIISAFEPTGSLGAVELLNELSMAGSAVRAIVLSATLSNEETVEYFRAQARGVLSGSDADFATLCKCVTCVHSGQIWANSEQLVCLIQSLSQPRTHRIMDAKGLPILTAREQEVLHLLAEGMTNRDISMLLKLSEHTVKNHGFHIFDKLGVGSRMEAVVYSFNHSPAAVRSAKTIRSAENISSRRGAGAMAVNQ